jgi:methylthioribose-1-phosphate isomerase
VYANETRPFLQGARLTAWELLQDDINVTLLVDSAAGYLMSLGKIDVVVVGADRIAANGDVANKIGTYAIACLCKHHRIPFYVAAPISTFDLTLSDGNKIHVEERSEMEVLEFSGRTVAPDGVRAFNPSFDITPKDLITGIITEKGTIFSPSEENVSKVLTFKTNSK